MAANVTDLTPEGAEPIRQLSFELPDGLQKARVVMRTTEVMLDCRPDQIRHGQRFRLVVDVEAERAIVDRGEVKWELAVTQASEAR